MTYRSCFVYLAVITALAPSSEEFHKPQTEQGNTEVQVHVNEHLFVAGNDSTGTAAITFTSRLDPLTPTVNWFVNHSFPSSCTSHPTRCRELTYTSHHDNVTNHTRLIFYVPVTGPNSAALGLMEFWHDGETISQNTPIRILRTTTGQCDPVSVIRVPKINSVYLICASGDNSRSLKLCEVRNHNNISSAKLSCSQNHMQPFLTNLTLLSNFVIYNFWILDLYFVYNSVLYHMTHIGDIERIAAGLQTSHCRYVHLAPVNASFLIGHCYEQNQVQAFYVNLETYDYIYISQENAAIAHYHCPDPQQLVTIITSSQLRTMHVQASYQDGDVNRGRFNLNASQVTFAKCFHSRNQTHFIYQDLKLGVFIKPNISVDLRSRLVQILELRCHHEHPCNQPFIFSDQYLVLTYDMDDQFHQEMEVFDLHQNLNRTLSIVTNGTAQIALLPDFTKLTKPEEDSNGDKDPYNKHRKSPPPMTLGVAIGVPFLVLILLVIFFSLAVGLLIRIKRCRKGEGRRHCRPYAPVAGSDITEEVKLKDIKKAHEISEPQARHLLLNKEESSSPTPPPPEETVTNHGNAQKTPNIDAPELCVVTNPEALPRHGSVGLDIDQGVGNIGQRVNMSQSSEEMASEDLPHHRSQHLIVGASQDNIPAAQQCTQPSIRTYISGCEPPPLQHNMDPTIPRSPSNNFQSYGMPLLECNESPTTGTSTLTLTVNGGTQFDSRLHDVNSTGICTIQHQQPQPGFQRQSSLPNPPRPRTLVPQARQPRLNQSPQLQRPNYMYNYNTNATTSNTTIHSLTPDNDLEYQRQLCVQRLQQQWPCDHQGQPTTARMNSSDSTNSNHSQTGVMSTHTPSVDFTHSRPPLPPLEHAYNVHASPHNNMQLNTVAQHQPMNVAAGHHHGPQNFQRLESGESTHSITSLTPESRPESGHQTGSMLVTGTCH